MNKLFIYFSETGNGDLIAEKMKDKGYEVKKIFTKRKPCKIAFFHIFAGGFSAGFGLKPKLTEMEYDLSNYDEVAIGSPIWNDRFASPINTLLSILDLSQKKVKFILYSGSGNGDTAIKRIKKEYPDAEFVILKQPTKYPEQLEKL